MNGRLTRFTMNPGASADRMGVLPQADIRSVAEASASCWVLAPPTTSTRAMTGAGLKKWRPRTRSGCRVAVPRAPIQSALVFDARSASSDAAASRTANSRRFTPRSSSAASMIRSAPSATSARDPAVARRPSRRSTSSRMARDGRGGRQATRESRGDPLAAPLDGGEVGVEEPTSRPASSATWAMPAPMVPAPMTPTCRSMAPSLRSGRQLQPLVAAPVLQQTASDGP